MIDIILKVKGISKIYEGTRVLSISDLEIYKGEKIALIGPSGAGKSTFLNILSNSIALDEGDIFLGNTHFQKVISNNKFHEKIGIMRQNFDLVGPLAVVHNVLAGNLGKWGFFKSLFSLFFPQGEKEAQKALERVGLSDKIYEKTSKLSGGEQQRVALARLLIQNPEIILADEPVSSLDPARSEDVMNILTELVEEKDKTLIASLHSVHYAKKYFNRIIAIKDGKIFFDLKTAEISEEDYKNLYTFKGRKEYEG